MHRVAASVRALILLGTLLLNVLDSLDAHGQAPDGGVPSTTETEKGAFVRHLLAARHLRVGSCRFAQAECERLMNEFVRGKDVEFLEPTLRSEHGQDAAFREFISPCLPPPVLGFFDTHEFYRAEVKQGGSGNAIGPFSIYKIPMLADSAHQETVLMRMNGFRFQSGDPQYFYWTKYARLDLRRCEEDQENSSWLFQLGDDTRKARNVYFADGVIRLGDEYYLYELQQDLVAYPDTYDAAAGVISVRLWKLQADIRAMSVFSFHAE